MNDGVILMNLSNQLQISERGFKPCKIINQRFDRKHVLQFFERNFLEKKVLLEG